MAEDTLDVCSNCGKMPRGIDLVNGAFKCIRCGNSQLLAVRDQEYESVVTELDRKYQSELAREKLDAAKSMPSSIPVQKSKPVKKSKPTKKTSVKIKKSSGKKKSK